MTSVKIKKPSNSVQVADMKDNSARKLIDIVIHFHPVIKDSTQVPNSRRRKYFNVKTKRQMLKAFIVIVRKSNEEFSFARKCMESVNQHIINIVKEISEKSVFKGDCLSKIFFLISKLSWSLNTTLSPPLP